MTRSGTLAWAAAGAGLALAITAGAAFAATPLEGRQAAMKAIAAGMKDGSGLASGAFDAAKAKTTMTGIAANAKKAHGLFPKGSDTDPKNEAAPTVWTQRADFDKRMTELSTLATAASKATTQEQFRPAFQKVGATCKGCHDIYRKKKS